MESLIPSLSEASGDVELELEYEIEEDKEAELENFVRLNHTGQFKDAHALFDECLSSHDNWYPAVAEYADCLLREGEFQQLANFSRKASQTFQDPSEKLLLHVMELVGNFASGDISRDAMQQKLRDLWALCPLKPPYTSLRDTDVHLMELFLLVFVSTGRKPNDLNADLTAVDINSSFKDFVDWFYYLLGHKHFWEAQRILHSLIHLPLQHKSWRFLRSYIEEVMRTNIGQESIQIAVSALIQRYIYVHECRHSSPLAKVPWNDAVTWAPFGVELAKEGEDSTLLLNRIALRRSLPKVFNWEISLPMAGKHTMGHVNDSLSETPDTGEVSKTRREVIDDYSVRTRDELESAAILSAVQGSKIEVLQQFLNTGAINTQDGYQRTPLHWAAINGNFLTTAFLAKNGADTDVSDCFGCSPLHYAVMSKRYDVVEQLLLSNPATVYTKNSSGLLPLHVALLDRSRRIAEILRKQTAAIDSSEYRPLPPFDDWHPLFKTAPFREG